MMQEKTQTVSANSGPAARAAAHEIKDRVSRGAHSGIDAATEATHPAIDRIAASAHKLVDNADEVATQAAKALEDAGVKGEELAAIGTSYMRDHPVATLGVAVAAGYLLSRLLSAR